MSKIRFCVSKKQNYCLSDSEFNFAETKIANFWQREHPVGDFSLVRFFWSSKEMNEKTIPRTHAVRPYSSAKHNHLIISTLATTHCTFLQKLLHLSKRNAYICRLIVCVRRRFIFELWQCANFLWCKLLTHFLCQRWRAYENEFFRKIWKNRILRSP